jgi:hypothetical protein
MANAIKFTYTQTQNTSGTGRAVSCGLVIPFTSPIPFVYKAIAQVEVEPNKKSRLSN